MGNHGNFHVFDTAEMFSGQDLQDAIVSLVAKIISASFTISKNGSF